jgi:hypothetical protein
VSRHSVDREHRRNRQRSNRSRSSELRGTESRRRSRSKSPHRRRRSPSFVREPDPSDGRRSLSRTRGNSGRSVVAPVSPLRLGVDEEVRSSNPNEVLLDLKGKQRTEPDISVGVLADQIKADSTPTPVSRTEIPRATTRSRPPRNRSLLESVHSHLHGRTRTKLHHNAHSADTPETLGDSSATTPMTTSRLGGPYSDAEEGPRCLGAVEGMPVLQIRPIASPDRSCVPRECGVLDVKRMSADETTDEKPVMGMPAPDIMARTRARLSKLKESPGVQASFELDSKPSESASSTHLSSNMRSSLLTRLDKEKRSIQPQPDTSPTDVVIDRPTEGDQAIAREARLRLQARLAAAKRRTSASSMGGPLAVSDGGKK